jgi:hypothetical protein
MRQGWKSAALAALACAAIGIAALPATRARAATTKSATSAPSKSSGNSLRQFTGYVTAMDKQTITVEKRGKAPKTMVFVRDEDTKSVGNVAKDGRVTVHYREEGGQFVAQRVEARTTKR